MYSASNLPVYGTLAGGNSSITGAQNLPSSGNSSFSYDFSPFSPTSNLPEMVVPKQKSGIANWFEKTFTGKDYNAEQKAIADWTNQMNLYKYGLDYNREYDMWKTKQALDYDMWKALNGKSLDMEAFKRAGLNPLLAGTSGLSSSSTGISSSQPYARASSSASTLQNRIRSVGRQDVNIFSSVSGLLNSVGSMFGSIGSLFSMFI